jgi:hypothetical protein
VSGRFAPRRALVFYKHTFTNGSVDWDEIDRVAQEIIWRLERGIAVVESCPGVAEVLESIELGIPAMANPSRTSSSPPRYLGEGRGLSYWQSAMDLAELQLDLSIAIQRIRILLQEHPHV